MQSETEIAEFLALLKDTQEQLTYFKELGVERIEKASPVSGAASTRVVPESGSSSDDELPFSNSRSSLQPAPLPLWPLEKSHAEGAGRSQCRQTRYLVT